VTYADTFHSDIVRHTVVFHPKLKERVTVKRALQGVQISQVVRLGCKKISFCDVFKKFLCHFIKAPSNPNTMQHALLFCIPPYNLTTDKKSNEQNLSNQIYKM